MKIAVLKELDRKHVEKIRSCGVRVVEGPDYDAEIVFTAGTLPDFSRYKKLKWIHTSFAGIDRLVTEELKKSKVIITNSRGVSSGLIAEHVFAFLLAFEHRLNRSMKSQAKRRWEKLDAYQLDGNTIGILGLGNIGSEVARLAKAFGCRVIAVTKESMSTGHVDELLPPEKMSSMLKRADYLVLCLPLTGDTKHLLSRKEFGLMKKSSILVNVGRGEVVDEEALVIALKKGKIRGACLDVFETEPLPKSSPLWGMENVVITAHYAGNSGSNDARTVDLFCGNLKAFLEGKAMKNIVNIQRGY